MTDKEILSAALQEVRDAMLYKLDGLSDTDMRLPMVPSGTNLLGLVKHLAGLEYGYLGAAFGRPAPERMSWIDDGTVWDGADMWAAEGETTDYLTGLYRRACAHADATIETPDLSAVRTVPRRPAGRRAASPPRPAVRLPQEASRQARHPN